ncbi:hypothetical protein GF362_00255 [Candidatus Dojkabacteria bacterium]|nr:hypothetical protein [Candidatus Dojkabacteria bacterium]
MNIDFRNPTNKVLLLAVIIFIVMIIVLIYFLSTPEKKSPVEPTPAPTVVSTEEPIPTKQILGENNSGSVTYYINENGNKIIEVKDPSITEQEAREILNLPDDINAEFLVLGAGLPKDYTEEDLEPPEDFTKDIDFEEWGLNPEHSE